MRFREAPLRDVLAAIARQGGIRLQVSGATDEKVSAAFDDLPLEQGFQSLVGHYNLV